MNVEKIQKLIRLLSSPHDGEALADVGLWCARREPSEKQAKWLHDIYYRIGRRR
jgi:hypothetical protein